MSEKQVKRLLKLADFFGIKTSKKTNPFELQEELSEKIEKWEEDNQREFPL